MTIASTCSALAQVSSVDVDDDMRQRGKQLAARLTAQLEPGAYDGHRRHDVAHALLRLLHEDDDVLRQPVPPLQRLFPAPQPETRQLPAGAFDARTLHVKLSPEVYAGLAEAADEVGIPVDTWVADELTRLHAWPRRPWPDVYAPWLDDEWLGA